MTDYEEFIKDASNGLSKAGTPITEYELALCKIVWGVAEVSTYKNAEAIAYEYYKLGFDARDVASELNRLARVDK